MGALSWSFLVVVALVAFAFSIVSNLFAFEFGFVIQLANGATLASNLVWSQVTVLVTFVISPFLLILVLYLYAKREHFNQGYAPVVLILFVVSAFGYVISADSVPLLRAGLNINGDLTSQLEFGAITTGLTYAFLGMTALSLSRFRIEKVQPSTGRKTTIVLVGLLALGVFFAAPVVSATIPGPAVGTQLHNMESLSCYLQGGGPRVWAGTYYDEGELGIGCEPLIV